MTAATVGFIGLGAMGLRMSKNLSKKYKVIGYDISKKEGILMAKSIPDLFEKSEVIITMLPTAEHVNKVSIEAKNLIKSKLWIDSSTVDPINSKKWHKLVESLGGKSLDAPVSGGVGGAEAASLTFMVGGKAEILESLAKPILFTMGKNIMHCGEAGLGSVAKVCNNMLLGTTMVAVSETLLLGKKLGMDAKMLTKIINTSSGRCWSTDTYNPVPGVMEKVPASNNYKPGFAVALCNKDMKLAVDSAKGSNSPIFLSSVAQQIYTHMQNSKEFGEKDFSAIYSWLENKH
eukprot:NODE_796_length_3843_cov_1.418269.p3 type:complete len:289 gc:universal NODE_796_length_3843_cov_1.418269:1199-2065(+)